MLVARPFDALLERANAAGFDRLHAMLEG